MNAIRRTIRSRPPASGRGQTIYQVLLIISCVAVALATFFPIYEYFELYSGPVKPHKFEAPSMALPAAPAAPAKANEPGAPPAPAPTAGTTAPVAAPTPTPTTGTTAPEAPKPADEPNPTPKPGARSPAVNEEMRTIGKSLSFRGTVVAFAECGTTRQLAGCA